MSKQLSQAGARTFLAGKIISNYGQSTIDCVVRRISDDGASVEVENSLGIPELFHLLIVGEGSPRPCKLVWQSDKQLGLTFEDDHSLTKAAADTLPSEHRSSLMRRPMLSLRAAFDEIEIGIVLLDGDMHAQFIEARQTAAMVCTSTRKASLTSRSTISSCSADTCRPETFLEIRATGTP